MGWKIPKDIARSGKLAISDGERRDRKRAKDKDARSIEQAERDADIAVLDFETDPFDHETNLKVFPFLAVLRSRQFPTITIWEEDHEAFISAVLQAILSLPRRFTIYAHNGGKFDFMFFIHRLRGQVMFKGRGIMSAAIGDHELRDSFHIIPEKLASYKKDDFDYRILQSIARNESENRATIIDYCQNDCLYLLDIVCAFVERYGRKLSIGQAAQAGVKDAGYNVGKLSDVFDNSLRRFYFGGRVECLSGIGHFRSDPEKPYRLFDVNSMYPDAMVRYEHPIGSAADYNVRPGKPGPDTVFLEVECENFGALVCRTLEGETSARRERGLFFTTIHEFLAATELGLIQNVAVKACYDCSKRTTFDNFIIPAYQRKNDIKEQLDEFKKRGDFESHEYLDLKKDYMFTKFFLNNAYGKYAQNPRRFKESYITAYGEAPPERETYGEFGPVYENEALNYAIWERPQKRLAFNNVGTAASITGGARATLLRALAVAENPLYCDTDSIICTALPGLDLHPTNLGAWDIEDTFREVIIVGKKLYAAWPYKGKPKLRSKGVTIDTWEEYEALLRGEQRKYPNKGPTMTKTQGYGYIGRTVRATGPKVGNERLIAQRKHHAV